MCRKEKLEFITFVGIGTWYYINYYNMIINCLGKSPCICTSQDSSPSSSCHYHHPVPLYVLYIYIYRYTLYVCLYLYGNLCAVTFLNFRIFSFFVDRIPKSSRFGQTDGITNRTNDINKYTSNKLR